MMLASAIHQRYPACVAANSAAGLGGPDNLGGHNRLPAVFLCPQHGSSFVSGPCGERLRSPVPRFRSANLHGSALPAWRQGGGITPQNLGVIAMTTQATNPSVTSPSLARANWHRRMALASLHADSSKAVRLARYKSHIEKARSLEKLGESGARLSARIVGYRTDNLTLFLLLPDGGPMVEASVVDLDNYEIPSAQLLFFFRDMLLHKVGSGNGGVQ